MLPSNTTPTKRASTTSENFRQRVSAASKHFRLGREHRKLKRQFIAHVTDVAKAVKALDNVMRGPASFERGRTIAQILNALELRNDLARNRLGVLKRPRKKKAQT